MTLPRLLLLLFTTNLLTFGNGRVMVPILERALVESTGALTLEQFLYAFTVGRVTPGPANVYVAGIGYMLYGWVGAALVMVAIMAPAYLVVPLHAVYRRFEGAGAVRGFARGITAASVGLLIAATLEIGQTTLTSPMAVVVCAAGLVMLNVLKWHTLVSVPLACALGLALTLLT